MTRDGREGGPMPFWLWPWCAFVFLVPFDQLLPGPPLVGLELAAGALLVMAAGRGVPAASGRIMAVCALMLVLCGSAFASIEPAKTAMPLMRVGIAFVTYLLATSAVLTEGQLRAVLRACAWGGGATGMAAIGAFLAGNVSADGRAYIQIGAYGTDPNFLAAGMMLPFALALDGLWDPARRRESAWLVATIVVGIGVTQSRGGVVAACIVLLATLVWHRAWRSLGAMATAVVAAWLAFPTLAPYLGRFALENDDTGSNRTLVWSILTPYGVDHWATGIGLDASPIITGAAPGFYQALEPHNTFIQAFVEAGLFGLLALLAVMAIHFALRGPDEDTTAAIRWGMLGFAASGLFLHHLAYQLIWVPWMIAVQASQARAASDAPEPARPAGAEREVPA